VRSRAAAASFFFGEEVHEMAWPGKPSAKQKTAASIRSRTALKPMPKSTFDNPNGIPSEVMRTLANENLSSDPVAFNARLQELLNAYKQNGG
jgi:hypothetical protein